MRIRPSLALAAALAWTLVVALAYGGAWAPRIRPLELQGPRLLVLAGILLGAFALGRALLRRLDAGRADAARSVALGLALASWIWLALGAAGGFRPGLAWGLLAAGAAAGLWQLRDHLRDRQDALPDLPSACWIPWAIALAGLLIVLPMALAPPASTDELTYHLAVPRWYAEASRIVALPSVAHAAFPFQPEMLYTWALLLGQPVVAKLIHFSMGLLVLAVVAREAAAAGAEDDAGSRGLAGSVAAALLASTPVFLLNMSWAWADVATSLYVLLGCLALLRLRRDWAMRHAILAGLWWGMALGSKYTALLYLALALPACLWAPRDGAPLSLRLRRALTVLGLALLLLTPYLARNAIVHGNPVHPLGDAAWGDGDLVNESVLYEDAGSREGVARKLLGPLDHFLRNARADDTLGPLWLLVIPLLLLGRATPDSRRLAITGLAAIFLLATLQGGSVRLQLPGFALLAIPAGHAVAAWWARGRAARALALAALVAGAASNLAILAWHDRELFDPVKVALGYEDEGAYLARMEPSFVLIDKINRERAPGDRVLALGADRLFWLEVPVIASSVMDVSPARAWIARASDASDVGAQLRREGVTHVLFARETFRREVRDGGGREAWTDSDLAKLDGFLELHALKDVRNGEFELYRVP